MDKLRKTDLSKRPKIILYSVSSYFLHMASTMDLGIDYCLLKPQSCEHICEIINMTSLSDNQNFQPENKEINPEKMVTNLLHDFGISANLKGYHYCRSAIIMAVQDINIQDHITKQLYPKIAEQYNTTPTRVEREIRHAIEIAWERGNPRIIKKYFVYAYTEKNSRPTNSEFISTIADTIILILKK